MRYLVVLMTIWAVPSAALAALYLTVALESGLFLFALLGVVIGFPLALVLTVVVLPSMALADAWRARDRRRARG